MRPIRFIAVIAALMCASPAALAAPETVEPDRFDALLRAIDVVPPDRAALEAAFPDAWVRLDRVARDGKRDQWSRVRALSLLSYFPEARTRATLEAVSLDALADVRRQAIYTLGRAFGDSADVAMVRFIEARAADPELAVAEHALRSLRWVDHPEAKLALDRLAAEGRPTLRTLAKTTSDKRTLRLSSPKRGH